MVRKLIYTVGTFILLTFNSPALPSAWINEFHYDNASTDVGEFVEVAGVAGTDLSGWSVILYNGSGGAHYGTIALTGSIDDEGSGYGAVAFTFAGTIQNGGPDGLALVNPGGDVEFLSYEGGFTASTGPATGRSSVDIGVSESSSTQIGQSLQLTGTGTEGSDFAWSGPSSESRGSLNAGQIIEQTTTTETGASSVPDGGISAAMFLAGLGLVSLCRRGAGSR